MGVELACFSPWNLQRCADVLVLIPFQAIESHVIIIEWSIFLQLLAIPNLNLKPFYRSNLACTSRLFMASMALSTIEVHFWICDLLPWSRLGLCQAAAWRFRSDIFASGEALPNLLFLCSWFHDSVQNDDNFLALKMDQWIWTMDSEIFHRLQVLHHQREERWRWSRWRWSKLRLRCFSCSKFWVWLWQSTL